MDLDVIVLAGGRSRRMGRDKAGIPLARKTLLEHVLANARTWGANRIVVAGPPRDWVRAQYIPDPPGYEPSSLLGLYAGMLGSQSPWRLVIGCDMPFVTGDLVQLLWDNRNAGGAAARWQKRLQPLPGLYPGHATEVIAGMLTQRRYHLTALLDKLEPTVVGEEQVAALDPSGSSFFNINSPDDLAMAREIMETRS